jgi:hypothetical protein
MVENIKMYHGEIGRNDIEWIHLTSGRVHWQAIVNAVINIRAP